MSTGAECEYYLQRVSGWPWFQPSGDVATQRAAAQGSALELAARDWVTSQPLCIRLVSLNVLP